MMQENAITVPALRVESITKAFGAFVAVRDVSFSVEPGEVLGIIGPNGAGKTTIFNLLHGVVRPTTGHIFLGNLEVTGRKVHQLARLGMARAFQTTNIFPSFSVMENLLVAIYSAEGRAFRMWGSHDKKMWEDARRILSLVHLTRFSDATANSLSHGDQRALELAIALSSSPKILLLDEPTAGMSPYETQSTIDLLKRIISEKELTVVLSEHDMKVIFGLADRITVLEAGRVLATGNPDEIRQNPEVRRAYLGE